MNAEATPRAKAPRMARRMARERALQGVYQWLVSGNEARAIEAHLREGEHFEGVDLEFFQSVLRGVLADAQALQASFAPLLDRPVAGLSPVERGVLMVAAWELREAPETPYKVVINEAVELAKRFGGTDGHKYVNGVLDKLARELRPAEAAARARPGR